MSVKDFLWDDEIVEIRKQHKKCQLKRYADRLKAMLLLNDGHSFAEVAKILILDDDTVRNWYRIFEHRRPIGFLFHTAKLVPTDCGIKMGFGGWLRQARPDGLRNQDGVGRMVTPRLLAPSVKLLLE